MYGILERFCWTGEKNPQNDILNENAEAGERPDKVVILEANNLWH